MTIAGEQLTSILHESSYAAQGRVLKEPEGNPGWPRGTYTHFLQDDLIIASELCVWTALSVSQDELSLGWRKPIPVALSWASADCQDTWALALLLLCSPALAELYNLHTIFPVGWLRWYPDQGSSWYPDSGWISALGSARQYWWPQ